jgi:hypothetical protein
MIWSKKIRTTPACQHLCQGEFRLQDRHLVAVARRPVGRTERVRQDRQPFPQQAIDRGGGQRVTDRLHRHRIVESGEAIECYSGGHVEMQGYYS